MPFPKDPEASDDSLIAAAREGNVRALEALLGRHEGMVLRVLRFLGIPRHDREDVAQEVFIRVFRHLDGFRRGRPFAGWVYRVTVNAAHDYRVRSARRSREEAPWTDDLDRAAHSSGGSPEREASDSLRLRLLAALETLSERERAVFVLKEVEGLDTSEVARALGITSITVRRHLGLARRRLRRELGASPTLK